MMTVDLAWWAIRAAYKCSAELQVLFTSAGRKLLA
jgi:hypothetical protein